MSELEEFTEFLFGEQTGFVYSPVKRPNNDWIINFFEWPQQKEQLCDWIRTEAVESDSYLSPVIYSEKKATREFVKSSQVVWIEVDGNPNFEYRGISEPSYAVQTSSELNKHIYWRIPVSKPEVVDDINYRLTYFLEADSSGWNVNHVLRPPETINHKPGKNLPVKVVLRTDHHYLTSAFDKAPEVRRFEPVELLSIPDPQEPIKRLPDPLKSLVQIKLPGYNQDRSDFLMNAGYQLAEYGLSHAEIVSCILMMDLRVKKFLGRHDQLERVTQLASIAILKYEHMQAKNALVFYSPMEIIRSDRVLEWYMPSILPKKGFMFLTGPPSVGKTAFVSDMMYALTTNTPWLNIDPTQECDIVYFCIEMFWEEQKHFWDIQKAGWPNLELWDQNLQVAFDKDVSEAKIGLAVDKLRPKIVVIDSLSEVLSDSKEEEARRITKFVQRLQEDYGTSFIFIHHNRKSDNTQSVKKPRSLSDLYGSYILAKSCQTVLSLWRDEGSRFHELDFLKGRFLPDEKRKTLFISRDDNLNHRIIDIKDNNVSRNTGATGNATNLLGDFGSPDNS